MKKISLLIIAGFLICLPVLAHQPYFVEQATEIIAVKDPEVSKAYYSRLTGAPHYYQINSDIDFELYVNILIPAVPETSKDMLVEIWQDNEQGTKLYTLDGAKFDWTPFFEEFARDDYFMGPEIEENVPAGVYLIKVSSPDNQGKYSLAIGQKEEFPPAEIVRSLGEIPKIKSQIFNKPSWQGFANIFGLFIIVPVVVLILIILGIIIYIKKRRSK